MAVVRTSVDERLVLIYRMYRKMFAATNVCDSRPLAKFASNGEQTLMDLQYVTTQYPNVLLKACNTPASVRVFHGTVMGDPLEVINFWW